MSTTSRILPLVNLAGCLIITGLIVAQWLKERMLDEKLTGLRTELSQAREALHTEQQRAAALERDVTQLKEAIQSTVQAKNDAEATLAKTIAERDTQNAGILTAAQEQVKTWEKAIAERDERIRTLNTSLTATRERLNEAIAELKKAGAR